MIIDLLDIPRAISVNKLEQVTAPRLFSNKMMYDPQGLLSTDIFGISKGDRRSTFAYIDLRRPFLHPHIYDKVLMRSLKSTISYITSGQKRYVVQNGMLVEDEENGWTGLGKLYENWDKIAWSKLASNNDVNKKLLGYLTRDQAFITKILVCPPSYRDVMIAGTVDSSDHVNELNELYLRLIRNTALLSEGGLFAPMQYATQMKIQKTLVEVSEYFKNQISSKTGLIRKNLLGKSVSYGTRSVISAPTYNNNVLQDNMIDMEHVALPISQCCSTFYPFIESWLKNFFTREIINDPNLVTFYDHASGKEIVATLKDPEIQFSEKNIKKIINDYCLNPDNRYRVINADVIIPTKTSEKIVKASMVLKGKVLLENNATKVLNRVMTVTDILYLACVDVAEKRHAMITRYPVGTDKGIFFNKIRVQSTKDHVKVVFNGKEYPFYPSIDFKIDPDQVGVQFIDTVVMSNSMLDGMGADYDGDQISVRTLWSDEANHEAERIMNSKMTALSITGTNSRVVAKEVFNSYYSLTKIEDGGKVVPPLLQRDYLTMNPDDFTCAKLAKMFADRASISEEDGKITKHKSLHNTWDTMTVPADYFFKGHSEMKLTVGRFILNKYVLGGSGIITSTGIVNKVLNKGSIGDLDNSIGQLYMKDVITRPQFNAYLDRRDNLGYWLNGMLAHTISLRMLKPLKEVERRKKELCTKYEKEIAAGDIDVMTSISNELVAYAKELLKGDPGMDLYDSGDLDFGNNYKNNAILKGAVMNNITGEFDFIDTSFMNGFEVKDIPAHANSILSGQYPASIATKDAGYTGKKLLALLQMMEVDEPGTDCGTKNLIPITITERNKKDLLYTYIDSGSSQLVELTSDNISNYVGKTVMMRSPMSCINTKICSLCAGNLFYMLDARQAGLYATQLSHSDLNLGLKAKHNQLVNLFYFDPDKMIEDI